MIQHPAFPVEPWALREADLNLERLAQTESVFALANGHVGLRGNLDEGEPHGLLGTYLAGFYESRPLPYAVDRPLPKALVKRLTAVRLREAGLQSR
jgi:alpha,alpha-trehalose phosphorylase